MRMVKSGTHKKVLSDFRPNANLECDLHIYHLIYILLDFVVVNAVANSHLPVKWNERQDGTTSFCCQ